MMEWIPVKTYEELWEHAKDSWVVVVTFTNDKAVYNFETYKPGHAGFKNRIGYQIGGKTAVLKIPDPVYNQQAGERQVNYER